MLFRSTASTVQTLDYRENSLSASVNQLVGKNFVLGVNYSFAQVQLNDNLPGISPTVLASARQELNSDLQHVSGYALLNHPSGFFARAEAHWYSQSNSGYSPALPGDDFFRKIYLPAGASPIVTRKLRTASWTCLIPLTT